MLFATQSDITTTRRAITATAIKIAFRMARTGAKNSCVGVVTAASHPV